MSLYIIFLITTTLGFLTVNKIFTKKLANLKHPIAITYLANIISATILLPFAYFSYRTTSFDFSFKDHYIVFLGGLIWAFAGIFSTLSVKKADVSLREPIITTRIIWVSIFGVVFLGEHLSFVKVAAILLIFIGIIVATVRIKNIKESFGHGSSWALLSALLTSVAVFVDKLGSAIIGTVVYTFFVYFIPAIIQTPLLFKIKEACRDIIKNHLWHILAISVTQSVFFYTQIKLYSLLPVSTIYPILQFSSILTILAAIVFLHERSNIRNRIIGTIIAGIGVIMFKLL